MSEFARRLNQEHLDCLTAGRTFRGANSVVVERINRLWWPNYIQMVDEDRLQNHAINNLDLAMGGREVMRDEAHRFCLREGHEQGTPRYTQSYNQFLKSNTGKMFERLIGFAICDYLLARDSDYVCLPFTSAVKEMVQDSEDTFRIDVGLGPRNFHTDLDADQIIFNPENPLENPIYFLTMKSTLKDRLHGAIFWNLLRYCSLDATLEGVDATNEAVMRHLNYVLICTDLAEEQPDLTQPDGPRNLIGLDVGLLDGAFVTGSNVQAVGDCAPYIGRQRSHPFHWLSHFIDLL